MIFVIVFFNVDQITWFNHSEKENLQDEDSENEQAMLDRQTFISEEEIEEKDNFEHLEAEDLENTEPLEEEDKTETNSWKVTHSKKPNPPAKKDAAEPAFKVEDTTKDGPVETKDPLAENNFVVKIKRMRKNSGDG